jgi:hypothetical protein
VDQCVHILWIRDCLGNTACQVDLWLMPPASRPARCPAKPGRPRTQGLHLYAPRSTALGGKGLALFEPQASLARPRPKRAPQVPRSASAGAQTVGAPFFWLRIDCAKEQVTAPPGALPGQRRLWHPARHTPPQTLIKIFKRKVALAHIPPTKAATKRRAFHACTF